jgi:hypothetical protein
VEKRVRVVSARLKFSRKHNAGISAKFNQVRLDGELNKTFGPAFAPGAVSTHHKITEDQRLFFRMRCAGKRAERQGDSVHSLSKVCRADGPSLNAWSSSDSMISLIHEVVDMGNILPSFSSNC